MRGQRLGADLVGVSLAWVLALISGFATPGAVHASTGGPEVAKALGWDPLDRKVFFSIEHHSESGRVPAVVYFVLGGSRLDLPIQVAWSKGVDMGHGDSVYNARLAKLRRRLRPLEDVSGETVFHYVRVEKVDTLSAYAGSWFTRYRLQVSDLQICDCSFEVTTLVEPSVRMIREFQVAGTEHRFGILSFRAIPTEMGYEVQFPVRLPGGRTLQRVEWKPWE